MKKIVIILIMLFLILTGCSDDVNSDKRNDIEDTYDVIEDTQTLKVKDFLLAEHVCLEKEYYECVDMDEIIKNENEMSIYISEEGPNGYFTYYKGDGIIYAVHSSGDSRLVGITLIDDKYTFYSGLYVGMKAEELSDLNMILQTSMGEEDPYVSQIVTENMEEGPLAEMEYDEIYRITGAVAQEQLEEIGVSSALVKGFVVFINDGTVVAVATDLPTAG